MIAELMGWRLGRLRRALGPTHALAAATLLLVVLAAVLAPLSGHRPGFDVDPGAANLGPGAAHWLGTDHLGRDTFWRLLLASRSFLGPGALAVVATVLVAVPAGALAGWYGGVVAGVVRFVGTVVASVPRFVLVLLVLTLYGDGGAQLALAAALSYAPTLAEDVYARIESLRAAEYLLASEAHGVPRWRVLWVHLVLGACGGLVARHALLLLGYVLVLETTLSYIGGFGVQEPTPSWGNMLVFEWGRDGSLVPRVAPAIALWCTVAATTALAGLVEGARRE